MIFKKEKESHANIYAALSAFQGELKPMAKNGKVQYDTSNGKKVDFTYTPLGDIMEAIYPLLSRHGLSVRHEITEKGVEAIITHETYEIDVQHEQMVDYRKIDSDASKVVGSIIHECKYLAPLVKNEIRSGIVKVSYGNDMKDIGGGITYARRYTLAMALGISSEEDKDAELFEQSAKNAIQTVFTRFKSGIEKATTVADVTKSMAVLEKDKKSIEDGKAPALGLARDQYEELIKIGEARIEDLNSNQEHSG